MISRSRIERLGLDHGDWLVLRRFLWTQHPSGGMAAGSCICGSANNGRSPACAFIKRLMEKAEEGAD